MLDLGGVGLQAPPGRAIGGQVPRNHENPPQFMSIGWLTIPRTIVRCNLLSALSKLVWAELVDINGELCECGRKADSELAKQGGINLAKQNVIPELVDRLGEPEKNINDAIAELDRKKFICCEHEIIYFLRHKAFDFDPLKDFVEVKE